MELGRYWVYRSNGYEGVSSLYTSLKPIFGWVYAIDVPIITPTIGKEVLTQRHTRL